MCTTGLADAVYVYAGTITSSPSPIPSTLNTNSKAAVAEFKHTVLGVVVNSDNLLSNSFVFGPVVIHPDFKVSITSLISSSIISGGENGILYFFHL